MSEESRRQSRRARRQRRARAVLGFLDFTTEMEFVRLQRDYLEVRDFLLDEDNDMPLFSTLMRERSRLRRATRPVPAPSAEGDPRDDPLSDNDLSDTTSSSSDEDGGSLDESKSPPKMPVPKRVKRPTRIPKPNAPTPNPYRDKGDGELDSNLDELYWPDGNVEYEVPPSCLNEQGKPFIGHSVCWYSTKRRGFHETSRNAFCLGVDICPRENCHFKAVPRQPGRTAVGEPPRPSKLKCPKHEEQLVNVPCTGGHPSSFKKKMDSYPCSITKVEFHDEAGGDSTWKVIHRGKHDHPRPPNKNPYPHSLRQLEEAVTRNPKLAARSLKMGSGGNPPMGKIDASLNNPDRLQYFRKKILKKTKNNGGTGSIGSILKWKEEDGKDFMTEFEISNEKGDSGKPSIVHLQNNFMRLFEIKFKREWECLREGGCKIQEEGMACKVWDKDNEVEVDAPEGVEFEHDDSDMEEGDGVECMLGKQVTRYTKTSVYASTPDGICTAIKDRLGEFVRHTCFYRHKDNKQVVIRNKDGTVNRGRLGEPNFYSGCDGPMRVGEMVVEHWPHMFAFRVNNDDPIGNIPKEIVLQGKLLYLQSVSMCNHEHFVSAIRCPKAWMFYDSIGYPRFRFYSFEDSPSVQRHYNLDYVLYEVRELDDPSPPDVDWDSIFVASNSYRDVVAGSSSGGEKDKKKKQGSIFDHFKKRATKDDKLADLKNELKQSTKAVGSDMESKIRNRAKKVVAKDTKKSTKVVKKEKKKPVPAKKGVNVKKKDAPVKSRFTKDVEDITKRNSKRKSSDIPMGISMRPPRGRKRDGRKRNRPGPTPVCHICKVPIGQAWDCMRWQGHVGDYNKHTTIYQFCTSEDCLRELPDVVMVDFLSFDRFEEIGEYDLEEIRLDFLGGGLEGSDEESACSGQQDPDKE